MKDRLLARDQAQSRPPEALPLDKRRSINTLLIAAAQEYYYLAYREEQIADMSAWRYAKRWNR